MKSTPSIFPSLGIIKSQVGTTLWLAGYAFSIYPSRVATKQHIAITYLTCKIDM